MDIIHSATAKAATTEPYACSKCDYSGVGHSIAIAEATVEQGGLVLGNTRAGEMARDEAEASAWAEAMSDVAMAPCPRCGAVDRAAWAAWIKRPACLGRAAIGVGTFAMGAVLCAAIFTAGNLLSMVCAGVMGPALLAAGAALAFLPLAKKRATSRRVRFEPPR